MRSSQPITQVFAHPIALLYSIAFPLLSNNLIPCFCSCVRAGIHFGPSNGAQLHITCRVHKCTFTAYYKVTSKHIKIGLTNTLNFKKKAIVNIWSHGSWKQKEHLLKRPSASRIDDVSNIFLNFKSLGIHQTDNNLPCLFWQKLQNFNHFCKGKLGGWEFFFLHLRSKILKIFSSSSKQYFLLVFFFFLNDNYSC